MKNSRYAVEKLAKHVIIDAGFAFKSKGFSDNLDDIPLVKGENVKQGFIDWGISKYWPKEDVHGLEKYWLKPDDIVVAMDRPWVTSGLKWSYIRKNDPRGLLVQRVARLRAKESLEQTFLRYLIGSSYFANYIKPIVTGVNVPHISAKQIGDFIIPVPALKNQKKIAAVLSTYDDLIENNNKRIALLEKAAEEIYREWFVRLRFPSWETTPFHKGIPEGWKIAKVGSLGKVITGKTPSKNIKSYYDGKFLFIKTPDMHNNMFIFETNETLTESGFQSQPSQTIPANSICVSCIGTGGIVSITTQKSQTNQQINSLILKDERNLEWGLFTLRGLKESIKLFGATGTTMTNLSKGKFSSLKILLPQSKLIKDFHKLINPLFKQIKTLVQCNNRLIESRDKLLSRLISGKLSVEDLDIQFPPIMMTPKETAVV